MIKIYHNPACRKSREGVAYLTDKAHPFEVVEYLKLPFSKKDIQSLLKALGMKAEDLIRKNEAIYKEKYKGKELSEDEWIEAMLEYPKLIERPIVIHDGKAVVARPAEKIEEILT